MKKVVKATYYYIGYQVGGGPVGEAIASTVVGAVIIVGGIVFIVGDSLDGVPTDAGPRILEKGWTMIITP